MLQQLQRDDQRFLAVPNDHPLTPFEKTVFNVASNGIGICAISHDQMPIGTHQCMGPGVPPGAAQDDGDDDGSGSSGQ